MHIKEHHSYLRLGSTMRRGNFGALVDIAKRRMPVISTTAPHLVSQSRKLSPPRIDKPVADLRVKGQSHVLFQYQVT